MLDSTVLYYLITVVPALMNKIFSMATLTTEISVTLPVNKILPVETVMNKNLPFFVCGKEKNVVIVLCSEHILIS